MKIFIGFLLGLFFFASCTKHLTDDPSVTSTRLPTSTPGVGTSSCKPVVMGIYTGPAGIGSWKTVMQKWYDENGRIVNIRAGLHLDESGFASLPLHLEWGEVTYHGNQMYVKNVPANDTIMRVTLDAQQRPVASYYYYNYSTSEPDDRDTSYYYFTGDRLDSLISINTSPFSFTGIEFHKYKFNYDAFGNLVRLVDLRSLNNNQPSTVTINLTYDYTQPVTDMLSLFMIDRQFKLMEYLDLMRIPIHHALTNVSGQTFPHFPWQFAQHNTQSNGLVFSYQNTSFSSIPPTVYVGWECGAAPANRAHNRREDAINSFDEFQWRFLAK